VLTGKYTRENAGTAKGDRGKWMPSLTEKDYQLLDTLDEIARELQTSSAVVALAWVQRRPGVTSTIIGARTLKQLDENLTALDMQLSPAHVATLDKVTEPILDFPSQIIRTHFNRSHAGATVNGIPSTVMFPSLLNNEKERY
jgi:aryl-alcohol dehydrogenase-like predicted oxidoreductase